MNTATTTWLITGCSSGLGRALAEVVLECGRQAVVTARDPGTIRDLAGAHPGACLPLELDVSREADAGRAVEQAEARFGGIDVLVNNAGYGYRAAVEEGEAADVHRLFETNFFGPVRMITAALPGMRARRRGTIVNISSIAATEPAPGSGYYAAAKAALEALTTSLRKELAPLGIAALIIEPGAFRTDFSGRSLTETTRRIADYADVLSPRRKENDTSDGRQRGDPARAAAAIVEVVESGGTPALLVLGGDALERSRSVLDARRSDLDAWDRVSLSTDFES